MTYIESLREKCKIEMLKSFRLECKNELEKCFKGIENCALSGVPNYFMALDRGLFYIEVSEIINYLKLTGFTVKYDDNYGVTISIL